MSAVPLRELCAFKHGGTPSKANSSFWQGEIPWVSPKDMKFAYVDDAADHISSEAIEKSATSIVPPGSILVVVRSGILAHSLPIAQVTKSVAFNQDIKAVLPRSSAVDVDYLYWFLQSQASPVISRGVKKGATVHSVQSGFIESMMVPMVPTTRQRRIVDLLSRAEGIVRLRREAQQKAADLIPAIFGELFGDPATNPKGWSVVPLGEVAVVQGGLQVSRARDDLPIERPYLRVANVHRGRLDLAEVKKIRLTEAEFSRTRLERGDLLFVEGHGNPLEVGRVAVWGDEIANCTHQNHLIRARVDASRLRPAFACSYLNSAGGRRSLLRSGKTTSGLSTISTSNVKSAPIALPPLQLQLAFERHVAAVEGIAVQQQRATERAALAFSALLDSSFAVHRSA